MNTETRFQRRPLIRLLAFICTLAMLLSVAAVLPITVSAKNYTHKVKNQKEFLDAMAKIRARSSSDTSTVTFTKDFTITLDDNEYLYEASQSKLYVGDTNLIFDLNGKTITFRQTASYTYHPLVGEHKGLFYLRGTNLTIRDNSTDQKGVMKFTADKDVTEPRTAFVYVAPSGLKEQSFSLEGGTLDGDGIQRTQSGGCVFMEPNSTMQTTFNMSGGVIQNFSSLRMGGAIGICTSPNAKSKGASVTISGGTIQNCHAKGNGDAGAIAIQGSNAGQEISVNITGGTIQNCSTAGNGGAISVRLNVRATISDITIQNCEAEWGGAIHYFDSTLDLAGGKISNCTAAIEGGAVYATNYMDSYDSGGSTTLILSGMTIEKNKASQGGGVSASHTTGSMTGGIIRNNTADGNGSQMVLYTSDFNMTGGEIYSSLPSNGPSAVYMYSIDKNHKVTIGGSAVVSVAGSSYAFDNDTNAQLAINGGTVKAYAKDGKAYRNKPQVASGMTMETDPTGVSNIFWSFDLVYVGSPSTKVSDYQEPFVRLSKNAVHSVKMVNNGNTVHSFMGVEGGQYTIPLSLRTPTRDGYVFGGWKDQDGNFYNDDNFYTIVMGNKDLTITAVWNRYEWYNLKWVTGGALPQSEIFSTASTYAGTSKIDLPFASMAQKDGFEIEGWYIGDTKLSGSGIVVKDIVDRGLADGDTITITAKYKRATSAKTYKLTYVIIMGGETVWSQTVEYAEGEIIASSPTPDLSEKGRAFDGWIDLPETMPGNDLTVKGRFHQLWAKLYFDYGNGRVEKYIYDIQVASDVWVLLDFYKDKMPEDPTPPDDYHYFDHWDGIPDIMPNHDVTATPVFLPRSYQLTIQPDNGEDCIVSDVAYGTDISLPDDPVREGYTFAGWEGVPADGKMPGEALVVTATWEPETYRVTFELGNGEQNIVSDVKYGETITLPTDPTRTGYDFIGWDGVPADSKMPAGALTVTAKWSKNAYQLTIKLGNGQPDITSNVEFGDTITLPTDSTNTGYNFTGWDGLPADGKMPANDLTITAKWSKNAYKLTIKLNNGQPDITSNVEYGETITLPADPTRTGYAFTGWDGVPADGKMPANDLTITAKWSKNAYKLTIKLNNGQPDITSNVEFGDTIVLPTDPTRTGYAFIGWDGVPADSKMPANDLTITAKWSTNAYKLTIKLNNGEQDIVSTVTYGDPITLPADPTRTGYDFIGWDGVPADSKMPANDLTITAKWSKNAYQLTIKLDNGQPDITSNVEYGDTITLPADPTNTGYDFIGWDGLPADGKMPAEALTITAKWSKNAYQLTFKLDNGQPDITSNMEFGDTITLPADPTNTGYDFIGWEGLPADGKMPAEALTVTAKWSKNAYQLTIKLDNGQPDITSNVEYGDTITLPTDPTNTGYNFTGWDGVPADGKMPAGALTVTAKWSKNSYQLTIKLGNGQPDITSNVEFGDTITLPADPTNTGYNFTGWDGVPADGKMPANDLTITAKWSTNAYKLTVKRTNGEQDIVSTVAYGDTITLPADPTRTGYSFTGWDGLPADSKMPANDLTITATWRKIGLESITIDPTADLTLYLTAYLPDDYANAILRVTLNGETVELQSAAGAATAVYNFTYFGVAPYTLSHSLTLALVLDGQTIDSCTTSAAEVCVEMAKSQPALKQTVADLMAFCAATADYLGYDTTTAPAIRDLMDANGLIASDREVGSSDTKYISARPAGDTRLMGVGLYFENTTGMYVRIKTSNVSCVTLTVDQTTYTADDLTQKDWTEYVLYLPGVTLDNLTQVNRVSLCVDGKEIQYMDYAISDYIAVTHKGSGTYSDGIRALTKALYNWKETAEQV